MDQAENDRAAAAAARGEIDDLKRQQREMDDPDSKEQDDPGGLVGLADEIQEIQRDAGWSLGSEAKQNEQIARFFGRRPPGIPDTNQLVQMSNINREAHALAHRILTECRPCADRSAAVRLVREAAMTANAAIVLDGAI